MSIVICFINVRINLQYEFLLVLVVLVVVCREARLDWACVPAL